MNQSVDDRVSVLTDTSFYKVVLTLENEDGTEHHTVDVASAVMTRSYLTKEVVESITPLELANSATLVRRSAKRRSAKRRSALVVLTPKDSWRPRMYCLTYEATCSMRDVAGMHGFSMPHAKIFTLLSTLPLRSERYYGTMVMDKV